MFDLLFRLSINVRYENSDVRHIDIPISIQTVEINFYEEYASNPIASNSLPVWR